MFDSKIAAGDVTATLRNHMLVDGFEIILDLEKSHGSWVVDARDGREYVDFFTGVASLPIGWNHPKMTSDASIRRLGSIAVNKPSNSDIYTTTMASFVETFHRTAAPPWTKHAFFVEGGSVGVENALKAAFDWKVQKNIARGLTPDPSHPNGWGHRVLHLKECFHGRTGYSLSLTDSPDPNKTRWFPKFDWPRITTPKAHFPLEGENLERTVALEALAVREITDALARTPNEIACLIYEPIQGEGGDNHFRTEFHQTLRRLADEHEFLLIVDEVQTGIGLTGKWWAHQHHGIEPDMICFGKKTQVCGFLAGPRIDEVRDNVFQVASRINSTWGGNLVDMARSEMYLSIIEEENLIENARVLGDYLEGQVAEMAGRLDGAMTNLRGLGLLRAFDLSENFDRGALVREAMNHGVILLPCGKRSLRFRPALNIRREELDEGLRRLETAIKSAYQPQPAGA